MNFLWVANFNLKFGFLPTEQELVETFKVSRYTIRKALSLLVE
ncbi:GntR family transcriptional regulator [Streptococcus thermophilus]|nr:GntR family transcriptional regulator [Streptococcus thermophilus]